MEAEKHGSKILKPLGRSISIGCVLFIVTLSIVLVISSFFNYRRSLYRRYQSYITDIINYVDRHIDSEDLSECSQTLIRSEKYDELEQFMDAIKEDFSIHYLYIIKPLVKDGKPTLGRRHHHRPATP